MSVSAHCSVTAKFSVCEALYNVGGRQTLQSRWVEEGVIYNNKYFEKKLN